MSTETMTWEQRGLRRRDGSLASRPWSQGERNAEWVRQYRQGASFHQIAAASPWPATASTVMETVTSHFTRNGFMHWRGAGRGR